MPKTEETANNHSFFDAKTKKYLNRKMKPLNLGFLDQETWLKDVCLQHRILKPGQTSSRALSCVDGCNDFHRRVDTNDPESFHRAIGMILVVAQCFGILPVTGVRSDTPKELVFKFLSPRTMYSAVIMIVFFAMASMAIFHMTQALADEALNVHGGIAAATGNAFFYGHSFLVTILFVRLAQHWAPLQAHWRATELFLDRYSQQPPALRCKALMVMVVVMIFAMLEHVLSIISSISLTVRSPASNSILDDFFRAYSEKSHGDYNFSLGIFVFCINKIGTFTWNFTDIFVILVSTSLAERYKTLNNKLFNDFPNYRGNINWREFRESYAALSTLVKDVDNHVSPIILSSFANNLCFICLQLFNGLSLRGNTPKNTVYFFGSFTFLVSRMIAVTLMAARIYDQSTVILPALYNCPSPNYNTEAQRLQQQLSTDEVCLTGSKFFPVTRNFMLAIGGAIVTYEVLLLQFNVSTKK